MQEIKSQNAIKIIERLKKTLKIKTNIELSEFLNVKPNTISTWKKRDSVDYDSIISICELYELDLNEIFLNKKKSNVYNYDTPLISREVQFQYAKEKNNLPLIDLLPKYNFPFVSSQESRAFQVTSNNMFPVIEENTFVICERSDFQNIPDGSIAVVLSQEKGLFINRVRKNKSGNAFILTNENEFFNDLVIDFSEISELWQVNAVLSYDVNNQNKFKFISDSVKKLSKLLDYESQKS